MGVKTVGSDYRYVVWSFWRRVFTVWTGAFAKEYVGVEYASSWAQTLFVSVHFVSVGAVVNFRQSTRSARWWLLAPDAAARLRDGGWFCAGRAWVATASQRRLKMFVAMWTGLADGMDSSVSNEWKWKFWLLLVCLMTVADVYVFSLSLVSRMFAHALATEIVVDFIDVFC